VQKQAPATGLHSMLVGRQSRGFMQSMLGTLLGMRVLRQKLRGCSSSQHASSKLLRRPLATAMAATPSAASDGTPGCSTAERMTKEQMDHLAALVADMPQPSGATALEIAKALVAAQPSAFTPDELDSMVEVLRGSHDLKQARLQGLKANMAQMGSSRGLFIVFEGLDRSGKSTQSKLLAEALEAEGTKVKWAAYPDRSTAIGVLIDLYLRKRIELSDQVIHELFSANRWEKVPSILTDLSNGMNVICDRYAFSGVAYSTAKGLDFDWCKAPDIGLPCPDAVFLHVDPKVGQTRSNFGDERYENVTMQGNVRREFQRKALREGVSWHDVDADRAINAIHDDIMRRVMATKQNKAAMKQLWTAEE